QSITHELQYFAVVGEDAWHLAIKVRIQDIDHHQRRNAIRKRSEVTHVRKPNRGVDCFSMSTANLSCQDSFAGPIPNLGIKQISSGSLERAHFSNAGERLNYCM